MQCRQARSAAFKRIATIFMDAYFELTFRPHPLMRYVVRKRIVFVLFERPISRNLKHRSGAQYASCMRYAPEVKPTVLRRAAPRRDGCAFGTMKRELYANTTTQGGEASPTRPHSVGSTAFPRDCSMPYLGVARISDHVTAMRLGWSWKLL
jgi:hypothetical protein